MEELQRLNRYNGRITKLDSLKKAACEGLADEEASWLTGASCPTFVMYVSMCFVPSCNKLAKLLFPQLLPCAKLISHMLQECSGTS